MPALTPIPILPPVLNPSLFIICWSPPGVPADARDVKAKIPLEVESVLSEAEVDDQVDVRETAAE